MFSHGKQMLYIVLNKSATTAISHVSIGLCIEDLYGNDQSQNETFSNRFGMESNFAFSKSHFVSLAISHSAYYSSTEKKIFRITKYPN